MTTTATATPTLTCPEWCITDHSQHLEDPEPCWSELHQTEMSTVQMEQLAGMPESAAINAYLEHGAEGQTLLNISSEDLMKMTPTEALAFAESVVRLAHTAGAR
ncbi:DUF6907 domain-containing protein [Arthrobacter sp. MDT3-44]